MRVLFVSKSAKVDLVQMKIDCSALIAPVFSRP